LRVHATNFISRSPGSTRHRRPHMRMFETAASTVLVLAAQALVVGAIITAL
jgi:hypothetical protein